MVSGPVQLIGGAAIVAVLMGSVLAAKSTAPAPTPAPAASQPAVRQPAQPARKSTGWFSGWFDGMEFNRSSASAQRPSQAPVPTQVAVAVGYGRVDLKANASGHFNAEIEIDGQRIPMLVDTGATLVTLSWSDANRIGVRPSPSDFKARIQTASGVENGARVTLPEARLGTLTVRNVEAIVLPEHVRATSLLGMSFLSKLKFEVADGSLVLRQ